MSDPRTSRRYAPCIAAFAAAVAESALTEEMARAGHTQQAATSALRRYPTGEGRPVSGSAPAQTVEVAA